MGTSKNPLPKFAEAWLAWCEQLQNLPLNKQVQSILLRHRNGVSMKQFRVLTECPSRRILPILDRLESEGLVVGLWFVDCACVHAPEKDRKAAQAHAQRIVERMRRQGRLVRSVQVNERLWIWRGMLAA